MSWSDRRNRLCRGCLAVPTISSEPVILPYPQATYRDKSETGAFAIIKLPYTDVPPALSEDYLRMYRQVGNDWVVVTDWELKPPESAPSMAMWGICNAFQHVPLADEVKWWRRRQAYGFNGRHRSLFETHAFADGKRFQQQYNNTNPSTLLNFNIEANSFLATNAIIQISSSTTTPVENLELDVGNDGTVDWRALQFRVHYDLAQSKTQ